MLYQQSAAALRRMRSTIWDYDNTPKENKAAKVLSYLKVRTMRDNTGIAYKRNAEVMWM